MTDEDCNQSQSFHSQDQNGEASKENKNSANNDAKSKKKKLKKRVQFQRSDSGSSSINATIAAYIPLRSELSAEEARTVWWNKHELEQLMLSARSMCRTKRDDLQMSSHLIKAYDTITEKLDNKNRTNYYQKQNDKDSNDDEDAIVDQDFDVEDRYIKRAIFQLSKWELNSDHRGLETWSCYEHELSRENAQRELTRMVLAAQRTHRMRYGRICEQGTEESDVLWDKVSDVSNRHSRHARIFAYSMGQADAAEVGIEIYPKKAKGNMFKKVANIMRVFKR